MRVEVNEDRCEGHGLCEATAPSVYELDDDGVVHVLFDDLSVVVDAGEAGARVCPVAALRVVP